jgi:predicted Zn-dependent protease
MMITVKKALVLGLLFLCFVGAVYAADLLQDLKKAIDPESQKENQSGRSPSSPGGGIDLGGLRVLSGFSQEEEIAIGRQAAGNILGAAPLVKDAKLQQYVNRVGRWVASQSERSELGWHFGVIESDDLNAFAAPGGYIFVTQGLYRLLQSESELAGVIAHEVGHVIRKHHLKILQQSRLVDMGGKLLAKRAGENEQIRNLIGNGAEIFARSLDKNAEFEADCVAVILAARAGYDPFGLPAVLQDIGHVAKDDSRVALLFKTHPHPDDRLAQLGGAIGDRLDGLQGKTLENRFYRIRPKAVHLK